MAKLNYHMIQKRACNDAVKEGYIMPSTVTVLVSHPPYWDFENGKLLEFYVLITSTGTKPKAIDYSVNKKTAKKWGFVG